MPGRIDERRLEVGGLAELGGAAVLRLDGRARLGRQGIAKVRPAHLCTRASGGKLCRVVHVHEVPVAVVEVCRHGKAVDQPKITLPQRPHGMQSM